jgi:hypothetical protein
LKRKEKMGIKFTDVLQEYYKEHEVSGDVIRLISDALTEEKV